MGCSDVKGRELAQAGWELPPRRFEVRELRTNILGEHLALNMTSRAILIGSFQDESAFDWHAMREE